MTVVLAYVQEKGLFVLVRVHKVDNMTKVETVFDWDSPEYSEILDAAKQKKTELKR